MQRRLAGSLLYWVSRAKLARSAEAATIISERAVTRYWLLGRIIED